MGIKTTVVTGDEPGLGGRIRAVSGPGAQRWGVGVVDTMRIDAWHPPAGPLLRRNRHQRHSQTE